MRYQLTALAVVAALLLAATPLLAGGPPRLCLPIDGVKADQVEACAKLLTDKLASKINAHPSFSGVQMHEYNDQRYFTFYMNEDVSLSEIEAALEGSGFSVPRGRLRVFGHAILELDARDAATKHMLTALAKVDHVSVDKSLLKTKNDRLLVTVDMPYPTGAFRVDAPMAGWETFERCDFSSDQATRSEAPATAEKLPSYGDFRDVVARFNASLKDIRWSNDYACRPLGGVAVPQRDAVTAVKSSTGASPAKK